VKVERVPEASVFMSVPSLSVVDIVAKHFFVHLLNRQNDCQPSVMGGSKPPVYIRMTTKCSGHISSPCRPSKKKNLTAQSHPKNFTEGRKIIATEIFKVRVHY